MNLLNASAEETFASGKNVNQMGDELHAALYAAIEKIRYAEIILCMSNSESWWVYLKRKFPKINPGGWFKRQKRPAGAPPESPLCIK